MVQNLILPQRGTLALPQAIYRKHAGVTQEASVRTAGERIEHASFTPVLSAVFYKRLASCECLANKWDQPYSSTMSWLHCQLTFSLLQCAHSVSEVPTLVADIRPSLRHHQLTWPTLNSISFNYNFIHFPVYSV